MQNHFKTLAYIYDCSCEFCQFEACESSHNDSSMETPHRFGASAGFRSWCGFVWLRRTDEVSTREIVDEVVDTYMGTSQRLLGIWQKQWTIIARILVPVRVVSVPLISEHCTSNGEPPFSLAQPYPRRKANNVPESSSLISFQFAAHVSWWTSPCRRLGCALTSRSQPPATTLQLQILLE